MGGMVVLAAAGTAAAIKLSQKDAQRIEEHTGMPPGDLTDDDLNEAMSDLGIQSQPLTDADRAAMGATQAPAPVAPAAPEPAYLAELEGLADLRDQGVISDADFQAKKKQLLGL